MNYFAYYLLSAMAVLIILTIHEYSHGYVAYRLGDNTAKNMGRLTLNPIKHIDPLGALCMLLFHVGWAKPVPINPRGFKKPKRDFALTALAGPLANLIMAFFGGLLYLGLYAALKDVKFADEGFLYQLASNSLLFLSLFHTINIGIALFNLIPIPPLDGSRILNVILPEKAYFAIMKYERKIYFAFLFWLILGDYAAAGIRMIPIVASTPWLYSLVGILSLPDLLGVAISFISELMLKFWQLIPFLKA